jgi:hypothetical protein
LINSGLRGSAMQRDAASISPSFRSVLAQQHHTAIAGHAAAVKAALHDTSAQAAKINLVRPGFFGTVWHWQSSVVVGVRYQ